MGGEERIKSTPKEAKRAIESSKAIFVKKARDNRGQNRAPAEARARFSMPEKRRGANLPRGGAVDPLCKEKSLRLRVRSNKSPNARENSFKMAKLAFYSNPEGCP